MFFYYPRPNLEWLAEKSSQEKEFLLQENKEGAAGETGGGEGGTARHPREASLSETEEDTCGDSEGREQA